MTTNSRKNTLIGAFIIGAFALIIVAATVLTSGSWNKEAFKVVMVFDGSVKGLSIGAPVAFRGVQIGQVTQIELIFKADSADIITQVKANIKSDNITRIGLTKNSLLSEMIERGLRAQLNTISLLTGLLYVQLDFIPDSPLNLADIDDNAIQIPTVPTDLERFTREIEQVDFIRIASALQGTLAGLNKLVNDPSMQNLATDVQQTLQGLNTVTAQLDRQLAALGPNLRQVLGSANNTVTTASTQIDAVAHSAQNTLAELNATATKLSATLGAIEHRFSDDSPTLYQLHQALDEVANAGRAIQGLADTLEQQPEALLRGKQQETP